MSVQFWPSWTLIHCYMEHPFKSWWGCDVGSSKNFLITHPWNNSEMSQTLWDCWKIETNWHQEGIKNPRCYHPPKKKRDPPGRRKLGHNHGQQGISRIDPDLHGTFHQWFAGQGLLITSLLFSSLEATGLLNNLFTFKGWNPQNMNHRKNPWNVIDFQQEWKADSGDRNMMKYYEV